MRVACLGAGYFSTFHREAWQQLPGVSVVGVADTDMDRATATGLPHCRLCRSAARQRHVVEALAGTGALENEARDYLDVIVLEQLIYQSADMGQRVAHSTP